MRVGPAGFGANFAAAFVLIYALRYFPLSVVANRFELRCHLTLSVFVVHLWTHQKIFEQNRNFLELSQNRYRAYFKHADYEYEHDFLKFCLYIGANGTKSGTNDQKLMFHRIVSKLVQSLFQIC